jgi:hypothetical protein
LKPRDARACRTANAKAARCPRSLSTVETMDRQAEALALAGELLADLELKRIDAAAAVLKANRLARLVDDEDMKEWLGYELHGYKASESGKRWMTRMNRWISKDDEKGYVAPLSDYTSMIEANRSQLRSFEGMSFSGDMLIPVTREHRKAINETLAAIIQCERIVNAVLAQIHEFAARTYYELLFSDEQASLFSSVQRDIDARLAPMGGRALEKIESVLDRLNAGDPEAVSGAMNTSRRLIDAVANALFEPRDEPYRISAEREISVASGNTLNRLQAYAHASGASKGRRDRLRRTLGDLYDRVSTGVHDDVTVEEARFIFLQTYVVIGEFLSLSAPPRDQAGA